MIHVYAVIGAPPAAIDVTGIDGAPVEIVACDDLSVVTTRHDRRPDASPASVLEHARVCDAIFATGAPLLPVRFGADYANTDGVLTATAPHASRFRDALKRLRGQVEVGVRALWPEKDASKAPVMAATDGSRPPRAERSGTEYLMRRVATERERSARRDLAEQIRAALDLRLRPCAVAARSTIVANETVALTAAYLIPRDDLAVFSERVQQIDADEERADLVCTGPWPPYSFAEEGAL